MEQNRIEQAVRDLYESRLGNQVDQCAAYFDTHAELRIAGLEADTPMSFQEKLSELVALWHFDRIDELDMLIDGHKAVSRYRLTATFNPTGEQTELEVADWITFNQEGLVTEFVQHLDTATLLRMAAPKAEN